MSKLTAGAYADDERSVHAVRYDAEKALVLDTGEKLKEFWELASNDLGFHAGLEQVAGWARDAGYDAIVADWPMTEHGDYAPEMDDLQFDWGASTFGEPQAILLYPERAKWL